MSEDKTQAATETVSESPAPETTQDSSNEQYIAESKKYRKRAQDAEASLAKYEKDRTKAEEDRLKEIQSAINETLEIKPHERKNHTVSFEEKEYKATSGGRRQLRLEWIKGHKDLKKEISRLDILKEIENFIIDNELGYAHDDVATGQTNGTFSQDKLKKYWIGRADKAKFPFQIVNPAYTSRECPKCGDRSEKNRNGDEFKCTNCEYENQSHTVGAINIGRKAMKSYSVK